MWRKRSMAASATLITFPFCRSIIVNVYDRVCEGLRRLLRQVVSDTAADETVRVFPGKFLCVGAAVRMRRSVGVTFKCYRRNRNERDCGKAFFQVEIFRFAFGQVKSPAI